MNVGIDDGTVSILGLVAGVAVSAPSSQQVLFAGATDFHSRLNDGRRLTGSAVRRDSARVESHPPAAEPLGPTIDRTIETFVTRLSRAGLKSVNAHFGLP